MDNGYKAPKYFKKLYDISSTTLRSWGDAGHLKYIRTSEKGSRKYLVSDVNNFLNVDSTKPKRSTIIYARVSSQKQKEDLERQRDVLKQLYPQHDKVITDIGSGVNFKRKGLQTVLELVCKNMVDNVIVLYKDRLARIGYDVLQQICTQFGTTITVHRENEKDDDGEHDDLIAVITSFVASHHGKRASESKKRRRATKEKGGEESKKAKVGQPKEGTNEK